VSATHHGVGSVLGRYVVAEVIGRGGMGAVYRAFDPTLRREVALKVIRMRSRDAAAQGIARMRLLREAQTMAQLNHPNVVPVFDVGVAPMLVFVAMELVRGSDLRTWLGVAPRTLDEILHAFDEAGRGLVAAHAVGVVHRDFKPSNVLVDGDDARRVRVTDFGLARIMGDDDSESWPDEAAAAAAAVPSRVAALPDLRLTDVGTVIGTVAYMAPEQHQGRPADPRSDQFAFAAALWEAIAGERPYPHDAPERAFVAKLAGPPAMPTTIPRWLVPILARALAPAPAQRFATMQEMLAAIARRGRRRRAWPLWGAAAVGSAVAIAASLATTPSRCASERPGTPGAAATPWADGARDRLVAAMTASHAPYADDARTGALAGLDAWARAWGEQLAAICDAAPGDRDTEHRLAQRKQCLVEQRSSFVALVDALADGGDAAARRAVDAVVTLPDLEHACDGAMLDAAAPRDDADAIAAVRDQLADAAALHRAGRYDEAIVVAKAALVDAEAIGHPPLRARAWSVLGSIAIRLGDLEVARDAMQTAYFAAAATDDAATAVVAALEAISIAGMTDDVAAVRMWSEHAASQIARMGSPPHLEAERLAASAFADWIEGTHAQGLANLERAHGLAQASIDARDPIRASIENQLALFKDALGRGDEALAHLHRALDLRMAAVGEHHPDVANLRVNLGMQLLAAKRLDEAALQLERAVEIDRAALRPGHPNLAIALVDLAIVRGEQGDRPAAIALHREGLAIRQAELGPDHPDTGASHFNLGMLLLDEGRAAEASEHLRAALAIEQQRLGPDDAGLLPTLVPLARAQRQAGDVAAARRHVDRAHAIARAASDATWSHALAAEDSALASAAR
jgi:tetratricopeptide (TPR) repeat protein/tRNA A-37 threonylcarbamoyl transferase component Bud32